MKLETLLDKISDSIKEGTSDYEELILRYKAQYNILLKRIRGSTKQFIDLYKPINGRRYREATHPVI